MGDTLYVVTATAVRVKVVKPGTYWENVPENWDVVAYYDRDQAEDHVLSAGEVNANAALTGRQGNGNPFDPNLKQHHRNVKYAVKEVKVYRHVDEFLENT